MTNPLVSVIVPNYQHEDFLRKRLDSILQQSFQDFELILLDDRSTDNSVEILKEYQSKREGTQLIVNEENSGGPFKQWIKGVNLAKGKYIWIAESDDFALPELLATNVNRLEENPKAVLSFCQSIFVDEEDNDLYSFGENYRFIYKSYRWDQDFSGSGVEECKSFMIKHNTIPNASAALIRKEAFINCGGPPVDWKLNGDWLFYCRLLLLGDLEYSAEPLNRFRKHMKTQRQRANTNARAYFEILEIAEFIDQNCDLDPSIRKEAYHNFSNWWIGSLFRQTKNGQFITDNFKLFKRLRKERSFLLLRIVYTAVLSSAIWLIEKLHLKEFLKSLRKKLFPGKYFEH